MKKGVLIELIQSNLIGDDPIDELESRYPYQAVEALTGAVYADSIVTDPLILGQCARPYPGLAIESDANGQFVMLPVNPSSGTLGIASIIGDQCGGSYGIRTSIGQNTIMNVIKPAPEMPGVFTNGLRMRLYGGPAPDTTLTVFMAPNFLEADEDDEIILPGRETIIIDLVTARMRQRESRRPEQLNDQHIDG